MSLDQQAGGTLRKNWTEGAMRARPMRARPMGARPIRAKSSSLINLGPFFPTEKLLSGSTDTK